MSLKRVASIVVTYNRLNFLKELIGSLREQSYGCYDIIVVNNSSTDGTEEWLSEQGDLKVITQANLGGAGGFFTGMKYAVEEGYDYVWVMDDDVVCRTDSLAELVSAIEVKEGIGFVCSRVLNERGEETNNPVPMKGGFAPGVLELTVSHAMVEVERATFVSVLFKREVICRFGLPLRELFIWYDDYEYTDRISEQMDCYVACKSVVTHKGSDYGFLKERNPRRIKMYFYEFRNRYVVLRKKGRFFVFKRYAKDCLWVAWCLLHLDFLRFWIVLKGVVASLFFWPKVEMVGRGVMCNY